MGTKWYASKTLWANFIAIVGDIVLHVTGNSLPAGSDVIALGVINAVLRFITKTPIVLS